MILIDKILIDDELPRIKFACDLKSCKGACCTFPSDYGAPVADSEVDIINAILGQVKPYLSKRSLQEIEKRGAVEGKPGDYSTVSINKRDCVFVYWDGDVAKCAIEKAYFDKKIAFRKPVSCHLFPIRVSDYGGTYLYYQRFNECDSALVKGHEENVRLVNFLKESISREYGKDWYAKLHEYTKSVNGSGK